VSQLWGEAGVLDIIEQLQGFEAAAGAWEPALLACRISDYQPSLLDRLCLGGEVSWGRLTRSQDNGTTPSGRTILSRTTPVTLALREALDWLLDPLSAEEANLSGAAAEALAVLSRRGASFLADIVAATNRLPSDVEEALWLLAAAGRVTSDGWEAVRRRTSGNALRLRHASRLRKARASRRPGYSRWSLLAAVQPHADPSEVRERQLLRRYGILFPELLAREPMAPRWRELVRILRRWEARGEIRGGRFVAGFVGEQFALPEAVELLRRVKNTEPTGQLVAVSACDPLNLVGILTPGERVPAVLGNRVVFRDGVPLGSLESGNLAHRASVDDATLLQVRALLHFPLNTPSRSRVGSPVS
jgi:ATP-dependent Lhr-like helicase